MAFTFGFYNSVNRDRLYDASDMSRIFDGIIRDGVYATIGKCFVVKMSEDSDSAVVVQSGRAWFDHTWNYLDVDETIEIPESELTQDRYDALVIDVDSRSSVRTNSIMWVKGTPSAKPVKPTMIHETRHNQYPLCYIYRNKNTETITQSKIENTVGTSECPFVTGVLQTLDVSELLRQWKDQWAQFVIQYEDTATDWRKNKEEEYASWVAQQTTEYEEWIENKEQEYLDWESNKRLDFESWMAAQKQDFEDYYAEFKRQLEEFENESQQEFSEWFDHMKDQLSEDAAGNLQMQVDKITETEFLMAQGLVNSTTTINSSTGEIILESEAATSITTFSTDDDGNQVITTSVEPKEGKYSYIQTTTIKSVDVGTSIVDTYIRRPK